MIMQQKHIKYSSAQWAILFLSAITSFLGPFLISSINVALPDIGESMHMSAVKLSWVITGFLLASAIFLIPMGSWSDLLGLNNSFLWGTRIY